MSLAYTSIKRHSGYKAEWIVTAPHYLDIVRVTGPGLVGPMEWLDNGEDRNGQLRDGLERAIAYVRERQGEKLCDQPTDAA